jgi:hypothetical protein
MYLGVSIDSLGFLKYYKLLYLELGMVMLSITESFYRQHDKKRLTDRLYAKTPARRKIRAKQRLENINKEWKREFLDKKRGHAYHSRMTAPTAAATELNKNCKEQGSVAEVSVAVREGSVPQVSVAGRIPIDKLYCKGCENYGHQRKNSRHCHLNPVNKHYKGRVQNKQLISN